MTNKEKTIQENIDESFNKTNQIIFEAQAHCCDIRKFIIDKEQKIMENETQTTKQCFDIVNCLRAPSGKIAVVIIQDNNYEDYVEIRLDNYEIKEENGKYYAVKKKPKYPKTYEECCEVIGNRVVGTTIIGYNANVLKAFQNLLICRNAYWKIAGEEIGLNKTWKPNLQNKKEIKYAITNVGNNIAFETYESYNNILLFPTKEMRNIFYENFTDLIEICKELL